MNECEHDYEPAMFCPMCVEEGHRKIALDMQRRCAKVARGFFVASGERIAKAIEELK